MSRKRPLDPDVPDEHEARPDSAKKPKMTGRVYKIICELDEYNDKVYVGSTTQPLHVRFIQHVSDSKNSSSHSIRLYAFMHEVGALHFSAIVLEEVIFNNRDQLRMREEWWREELGANLNMVRAFTSADVAEADKQAYIVANKELIAANKKLYEEKNKVRIRLREQRHRIKNAARIKEQSKIEYAENKEKHAAKCSAYYIKNKEKMRAKHAAYREKQKLIGHICVLCGSTFTCHTSLIAHYQTLKHMANVNAQTNQAADV